MPNESLGEFEQMVLLAIVHLSRRADDSEVYGVSIMDEIERRTQRDVSRAAVYVTLRRLEKKGLLASWMSAPRAERGGKARRCVRVSAAGLAALNDSRRVMDQMWGALGRSALEERS